MQAQTVKKPSLESAGHCTKQKVGESPNHKLHPLRLLYGPKSPDVSNMHCDCAHNISAKDTYPRLGGGWHARASAGSNFPMQTRDSPVLLTMVRHP